MDVCVATYLPMKLNVYLPRQSLTAGTLVLGAVQEIGELEITVSLPNNMCGVVAISNVSDPITEGMENELEEGGEEERGGEDGGGEGEVRVCVTASSLTCVLLTAGGTKFSCTGSAVLPRPGPGVLCTE